MPIGPNRRGLRLLWFKLEVDLMAAAGQQAALLCRRQEQRFRVHFLHNLDADRSRLLRDLRGYYRGRRVSGHVANCNSSRLPARVRMPFGVTPRPARSSNRRAAAGLYGMRKAFESYAQLSGV